jgi:hypothetical protein
MSAAGSIAVVNDVIIALKGYLQSELNTVLDAANVEWSMMAPDSNTGYGYSPTFTPQDRFNSIMVWVDSRSYAESHINASGAYDEDLLIGILWLIHANDPNRLEQMKQIGTNAITRVLWRRWRVDFTSDIYQLTFDPIDFRFSSLRMRGGSSKGLKGYDQDTGDNIDGVIIGVRCKQRVDAPIDQV